ncbi:hypothetical protein T09_12057 [Trichinella sp. T9]|nr:hypothetical protein T09_12057 [Trichinella sp. T9]
MLPVCDSLNLFLSARGSIWSYRRHWLDTPTSSVPPLH